MADGGWRVTDDGWKGTNGSLTAATERNKMKSVGVLRDSPA